MDRPIFIKLFYIRYLLMAGELGFEPRFSESESDVLPLNYYPSLASYFHTHSCFVFQSLPPLFSKLDGVLFTFYVPEPGKPLAVNVLGIAHDHLLRHTQLSGNLLMF